MCIIVDFDHISQFQELVMKYFCEAKWLNEGYVPSMDEYKSVSLRSIGFLPIAVASFIFMGDIASREIFEWEMSNPKIIIAAETIFRFLDDIAGHKVRVATPSYIIIIIIIIIIV